MQRPGHDPGSARPPRVDASAVAERLRGGGALLLVCAYDSPVAWSKFGLAGALPLSALEERLDALEPDQDVVLYCRCPDDGSADRAARRLLARGVAGARVLAGGYSAAVAAGLRPLRRR